MTSRETKLKFFPEITLSEINDSWNSGRDKLSADFFKRFSLTIQSNKDIINDSIIHFLIKVEKCQMALNEICKEDKNYLQKEDYVNWLDKHEYLKDERYSLSFYPFPQFENFNNLFFKLSQFKNYVDLTEECSKANLEFISKDISNEYELIEWLIKFETLGNKMNYIFETSLNKDENEEEFEMGFVTAHEDLKIKISLVDFKHVLKFVDNFFIPYWRFYEKYSEEISPEINETQNERIENFKVYKSLYDLISEKKKMKN